MYASNDRLSSRQLVLRDHQLKMSTNTTTYYTALLQDTSSCRFNLIDLPTEVVVLIMRNLERQDLARIALVSTSLCSLAQPILFESVNICYGRHAAKLVRARGRSLAPSTANLLASYTQSLVLGESLEPDLFCIEALRQHLYSILAACNRGRLQNLEILFHPDANETNCYPRYLATIEKASIFCNRVYFSDCSWSFIRGVIPVMGDQLLEIQWHCGWITPRSIPESPEHTWSTQLSNLTSLVFTDLDADAFYHPFLYTLLKGVASTITSLSLTADHLNDNDEEPSWQLKDTTFPRLAVLELARLPYGLYQMLLEAAPRLHVLQVSDIMGVPSSLLSTVPPGIRQLEAEWLDEEVDPLDTLVTQMKRLKYLEYLPVLQYDYIFGGARAASQGFEETDETRRLLAAKVALLEHFDSIGLAYTADERDKILQAY
ncbi:hypothetical protein P389DRAFT_165307 [Cystobasidium minutum MCA 4210]|uniref:uncharacterized protein n=1 Tax=Cystobasidium minutum MCA 4210 TaxID=1397322 RepID=UPI0034CD364E|eukprot:jgi/Rhomi1/165307/fgenesh1_kg.1_\